MSRLFTGRLRVFALVVLTCVSGLSAMSGGASAEPRTQVTRPTLQRLRPVPLPPPPAPPPRPPTPAPQTALSGFEIITGSTVSVAPLSSATIEVPCSGAKIAISAGYLTSPANASQPLAARGLEIHQAMPDGGLARVTMRNANVFEPGTFQGYAVCINPVAGLRVDANPARSLDEARCTEEERVIGGGFMATAVGTWISWSAPTAGPLAGGSWTAPLSRNSFAPQAAAGSVVALCAPKNAVAGWSMKESVTLSLGAQSSGSLSVGCDAGTPIAAGVQNSPDGDYIGGPFLSVSLLPSGDRWNSVIWNKDLGAGPGAVRAKMRVICAQTVP